MSIVVIKQRVAKLETAQDSKGKRQHVLEAFTDEEADRKQAELIASGAARSNDLFVIIRRFRSPSHEGLRHDRNRPIATDASPCAGT